MTKIYRTSDNDYVALVSHDRDLTSEGLEYFGTFEYSLSQDYNTGEWRLGIYDLAESEILEASELEGVDGSVVAALVAASQGVEDYEDIVGSDYYDRGAAYELVLNDEVLFAGVGAYYLESEEN